MATTLFSRPKHRTVLCDHCGALFTITTSAYQTRMRRSPSKKMYCSIRCSADSRKGKQEIQYS